MFAGDTAGVAARPAAGLTAGCPACAAGVTAHTRLLRPILILLVAWFGVFLAFNYLARALIQQRP